MSTLTVPLKNVFVSLKIMFEKVSPVVSLKNKNFPTLTLTLLEAVTFSSTAAQKSFPDQKAF